MYNINNLTSIACIATYTECQVGTCQGKANKKIMVREFSTKSWKSLMDMFHNVDRPYTTPFGQVVVYL